MTAKDDRANKYLLFNILQSLKISNFLPGMMFFASSLLISGNVSLPGEEISKNAHTPGHHGRRTHHRSGAGNGELTAISRGP